MFARRKPVPQLWNALFKRGVGAEVSESWANPAALIYGIDDLRFEDLPFTVDLPSNYVRVRMRAVGICGSDVHMLKKVRT